MARIGVVSIPASGHLYSIGSLARKLASRGHDVVYFDIPEFQGRVEGAGLEYRPIGRDAYPVGTMRGVDETLASLKGLEAFRFTIRRLLKNTAMVMDDLPAAAREAGVEALVVDQSQMAGGTVADFLGVPYVTAASALPLNLDPSVPPFQFSWRHGGGVAARMRNRSANWLIGRLMAPVATALNERRRSWGLPPVEWGPGSFSRLAQVSQLPAALELPGRRLPPSFHHTGPWTDADARSTVDFPWDRLDGRPLAYVSMGTILSRDESRFRAIAEGCAGTGLQLVVTLGGGGDPARLGDLPGDPIVVGFAPQIDLIRRSTLTISHGGLNTTLESLSCGVPTLVLPVTNDQPGVGLRVAHAGVGRAIPLARATAPRILEAVRAILDDPSYRERATTMRSQIAAADGLNRAADVILDAFRSAVKS